MHNKHIEKGSSSIKDSSKSGLLWSFTWLNL